MYINTDVYLQSKYTQSALHNNSSCNKELPILKTAKKKVNKYTKYKDYAWTYIHKYIAVDILINTYLTNNVYSYVYTFVVYTMHFIAFQPYAFLLSVK